MRQRLIFMDMDGTIIHGGYSGAFLCLLNGVEPDALRQTELPELRGEIDWVAGDRLRAAMMAGLGESTIHRHLSQLKIIGHLPEFLAAVKALGFLPVLASAGPSPVAAALAERYGFARWFSSRYEVLGGQMTGRITDFVTARGKADRVLALCGELGADPRQCVAVGDGGSDLEMFATVGCAIALNGQPAAEAAAHHRLRTGSILDALPLIEAFTGVGV